MKDDFNAAVPVMTIEEDGTKQWLLPDGTLHREDGPAQEGADGYKAWYRNGKLHRDDGPAIEYANGTRYWCRNDIFHREDGPAIERADDIRLWCRNGKFHREDGPAVEYADGRKEWWIENAQMTEKQFNAIAAAKKRALLAAIASFRTGLASPITAPRPAKFGRAAP